jgi:hypothetical protein
LVLLEGQSHQGVFPSTAALLHHVEAIDVSDGAYTVFDATGRRMMLEAAPDRGPVTVAIAAEVEPSVLQAALADAVSAIGPARVGVASDADLDDLVRAVWRFEYPRLSFPGDIR